MHLRRCSDIQFGLSSNFFVRGYFDIVLSAQMLTCAIENIFKLICR